MKKLFPILMALVLLTVAITPVSARSAQDTGAPAQLEYIDAQVDVLAAKLATYQADYYASHGRYYQVLTSHSVVPAGLSASDMLDSHPSYQAETLQDFWTYADLPERIAFSFQIDGYESPDGPGYDLIIRADVDGIVYVRGNNYGPASEDWRTSDWYQVEE